MVQARYRAQLEITYGTDPGSQPLAVDPTAYRHAVGEPNRSRYYGLGSALTAARHLPEESRGSTSYHADDGGAGAGTMSRTSEPDESFLRRLDDLETRQQRMSEEAEARYHQLSQQFEESQSRLREEMRADAEVRDREQTQRFDEGQMRLRDEARIRDDRLVQTLTDAMDRRLLRMFAFCRDERRGPFDFDSDQPPRDPPDPPAVT